jgi:di/tricarboxylate transporter
MVRAFDPVLGLNVAGEGWSGGALDAQVLRDRMSKALDVIMAKGDWRRGLSPKSQTFVAEMVRASATAIVGSFLPTLGQVRYVESVATGGDGRYASGRH